MTEFSANMIRCIEEWSSAASKCDGNSDCLEECAQRLRNWIEKRGEDNKEVRFKNQLSIPQMLILLLVVENGDGTLAVMICLKLSFVFAVLALNL